MSLAIRNISAAERRARLFAKPLVRPVRALTSVGKREASNATISGTKACFDQKVVVPFNSNFVHIDIVEVPKEWPSTVQRAACEEALANSRVNPDEVDLFISHIPSNRGHINEADMARRDIGLTNSRVFLVENAFFLSMLELAIHCIQ